MSRAPEQVENLPVSALAVRIISGWSLPECVPEAIAEFNWAEGDLSAFASELSFEGEVLKVNWDEADGLSRVADDALHKQLFGEPFRGSLASGWTFAADTGMFTTNRLVEGHYWSMKDPEGEAVVWVAEVHGLERLQDLAIFGNVAILGTGRDGSIEKIVCRGHRFQGAYTYYLVPGLTEGERRGRWFIVIDGGRAHPARNDLFKDILALQFVLGTAFYFDVVEGLSRDGRSVARLGGRYGRDHRHRPRTESVVPMHFVREHWGSRWARA